MSETLLRAFSWLKGLTIVHFGLKAIKQLWPFILAFIFWPEIDQFMSDLFPFWSEYLSSVSSVIINGANYFRSIPILEPIFSTLDELLAAVRIRLIELL